MTTAEWIHKLLEILCKIYQFLGGECKDLPVVPEDRIKDVHDYRKNNGPPPTSVHSEMLAALAELNAHLALPENTLGATALAELQELIDQLTDDCEP